MIRFQPTVAIMACPAIIIILVTQCRVSITMSGPGHCGWGGVGEAGAHTQYYNMHDAGCAGGGTHFSFLHRTLTLVGISCARSPGNLCTVARDNFTDGSCSGLYKRASSRPGEDPPPPTRNPRPSVRYTPPNVISPTTADAVTPKPTTHSIARVVFFFLSISLSL